MGVHFHQLLQQLTSLLTAHYSLQALSNPTLGNCPPYQQCPTCQTSVGHNIFSHIPLAFCWTSFILPGPHSGVCDGAAFYYRLHNFNSVFMAELCALYRALQFIWHQPRQCRLICTDSLSSLQIFSSYSLDHPIVNKILIQLSHFQKAGKSVVFCWVPHHTGLPGNRATDAAAKVAASHETITSDRALGSYVCILLHHGLTLRAKNWTSWSHPC